MKTHIVRKNLGGNHKQFQIVVVFIVIMVHPWEGSGTCKSCKHPFKDEEWKVVYEDWGSATTDREFRVQPERKFKCLECAGREGSGFANKGRVESYKVKHKSDYVS